MLALDSFQEPLISVIGVSSGITLLSLARRLLPSPAERQSASGHLASGVREALRTRSVRKLLGGLDPATLRRLRSVRVTGDEVELLFDPNKGTACGETVDAVD